jgi:hypothetical protein
LIRDGEGIREDEDVEEIDGMGRERKEKVEIWEKGRLEGRE